MGTLNRVLQIQAAIQGVLDFRLKINVEIFSLLMISLIPASEK